MTQNISNNQNVLKKENYIFYNQKFGLVFSAQANKYKTLIELYVEILKLLPPSEQKFDLISLSGEEKSKINNNFSRAIKKNQAYLGWKAIKASDWDPKKFPGSLPMVGGAFLKQVDSKEFFSKDNTTTVPRQDFLNKKINDKIDLTEIFESVNKFLKSYFSELAFNKFQDFILQLKNNDGKIIATYLSDQVLNAEFKAFSQPENRVFSKETMINFLSQSDSLYHHLCLWFLESNQTEYKPITLKEKEMLCIEKHHIIPRYLNANHDLNGSLEEFYNLIKIPRLVHVLFHFIRTIEFQYYEDQNYVKSLGPKWNIYIKDELKILEFNNILKTSLKILNMALENSHDFQTRKKDFFIKRDLATEANLNSTIKETFSKEMTWINREYPINSVTIAPNVIRKVRDLFDYLIEILQDYFKENQVSEPENWNKLLTTRNNYDYLSDYLKGDVSKQNPFFGWLLENPNSKMIERAKKTEKVQKRGTTSNPIIDDMLDNGGYFWQNNALNISAFEVKPGRFETMTEFADYLVSLMPENKQPKNWFTQNKTQKKTRLSKGFTQLLSRRNKVEYYGWKVKKINKFKSVNTLSD